MLEAAVMREGRVCYDEKQVRDAPSIGTDGELPAGDEEAIFTITA